MAIGGLGGVRPVPMGTANTGFRPYQGEHVNALSPAARDGGRTNRSATAGALAFKNALGLPSYEDILGKLGGGQGTREFGNAGLASEGAAFAKGEVDDWKGYAKQARGAIGRARKDFRNPTGTEGFRNVMRLTNERLGQAVESDRIRAADAASRRGFVGGYSGERSDRERLEALAAAGYETADRERLAQGDLLKSEIAQFGNERAGYGDALSAYTDLTKTAAELPTKWLDAYSGLLSGLGGQFGDIFGTSSRNVQFDTLNEREDQYRPRFNGMRSGGMR